MIYLLTSSKDASVYSLYPTKNTGLDEILTISKTYTSLDESDIARTYIKFNVSNLPSYVTASSVTLQMKITEVVQLPLDYTIYAYPVSQDWNMGVGTWPEAEGINTDGITWLTQPSASYITSASQIFSYEDSNINMNVLSLYNYWRYTGSNYGIQLAHSASEESSSSDYGTLKFYSKETNTYERPVLQFGWDDSTYITGSLKSSTASTSGLVIKSKELNPQYLGGAITRINLAVREKFPTKTFSQSFGYMSSSYLPQESYYAVLDDITKTRVIDFSTYTKISCDGTGSYIMLNTVNFPTNRPLRLEFSINRSNGWLEYHTDDLTFTIK